MKRVLLKRSQRFIIWLGLLPLLLAFMAYRTSRAHIESVQATLSTDEFIRRLDELFSTMQDAETGQRGFLLTGDERYLGPFADANSLIGRKFSEVESLAHKDGVSEQQIENLRNLVNRKMGELRATVDLRRKGGLREALTLVNTDQGQLTMTAIRNLIGDMKTQQVGAFQQRWKRQQQSQWALEAVLAIGIVIGFLLLSLAYRFNSLYAHERDEVEREIRNLNNTLELRVNERTAELEARTKELEKRTAELQRSNSDLMQFAYVASHDLQEPLRMVGSYMGLLARRYQGKLDETADRYIQFAVDGANRMQTLIHDLLTYSRAGTQALEKKEVSFEDILQAALKNLDVAIRESSAKIDYENLPLVLADETKLVQVMQNLIGNAIKFRKPGVAPQIQITSRQTGDEWMFAVTDNGIGFESRYNERIFEVFQRLHGMGSYPGNGIGLAICRRIIEHHGGQLWADSEPDV